MQEHSLLVQKTARYYTLGQLNASTREVWLVLHGFGQLAGNFIQNFTFLQQKGVMVVAPEALNHYYLKGAGGQVGATWMTKENRLAEIQDYCLYLDSLYEALDLHKGNLPVTALGFSQGSSTVTRWANFTRHHLSRVIAYAGEVAPDILPLAESSPLHGTKRYLFYGIDDEIIPVTMFEQVKEKYMQAGFKPVLYNGKHEIVPQALQKEFF